MPKFFKSNFNGFIDGDDAKHIFKSLRMKIGEDITVCDGNGYDYHCKIEELSDTLVKLLVKEKIKSVAEPDIEVTLYQCFLKGDKFCDVIKHSVELGVTTIVPVLSEFCVSRPNEKDSIKKIERYNKIAKEAAKQSGRGIIPKVLPPINIKDVPKDTLLFYECGGEPINKILPSLILENKNLSVLIGSEGGFSQKEAAYFKNKATLGKRILRAETAPLAALTAIMLLSGNLE